MNSLLIVGVIPLVWSAAVFGLAAIMRKGRADVPDDGVEKRVLAAMAAPLVIGLLSLGVGTVMPADMVMPLPALPGLAADAVSPANTGVSKVAFVSQFNVNWRALLIGAVFAVYLIVAAARAVRLVLARRSLSAVVARSTPSQVQGHPVQLTEAIVPAFAWRRGRVIIPRGLQASLSDRQLAMLVAHERGHVRRGDPNYYLLLSWIDVWVWFNPFVRQQTTRCRLAAELACDALVMRELTREALETRPETYPETRPEMQKAYAESLLLALKHTTGNTLPILTQSGVPAVFSPSNSGEFRMRIGEIMRITVDKRKSVRWIAALAVLLLPLAGLQLAWAQGLQRHPATSEAVYAPGDGTVLRVHKISKDDPDTQVYGDNLDAFTVEIDHGDGVTSNFVAMHGTTLKAGDRISKGQKLQDDGAAINVVIRLDQAARSPGKADCPATGKAGNWCVFSDTMNGEKQQFIAWGHAELRAGGRIVRADMIHSDQKGEIAFAQGHAVIDNGR